MIPIKLEIQGFLSYRAPTSLDFTTFDLACISGHNGAGKSSLLDAITWGLFGQARNTGESVITLGCEAAAVALEFEHEGNEYRVLRSLKRGKSTLLEFQVLAGKGWKPLTEKTVRETQARIEETLKLDYETFISASFFLQGKADSFTTQKPGDRKRILGNILGLDGWEAYREGAAERRRQTESQIAALEGIAAEISQELENEPRYQVEKAEAEKKLAVAKLAVDAGRSALAALEQLAARAGAAAGRLRDLLHKEQAAQSDLTGKQREMGLLQPVLERAQEIAGRYQALQATRQKLAAAQEKVAPGVRLQADKEAGQRELSELNALADAVNATRAQVKIEEGALDKTIFQIAALDPEAAKLADLRAQLDANAARQGELKSENAALRQAMAEIKRLLGELELSAASCPVCGQALTPEHRAEREAALKADGKARGNQYRANEKLTGELSVEAETLRASIAWAEAAARQIEDLRKTQARLEERITGLNERSADDVESKLKAAQERLAQINQALADLGYDPVAFEQLLAESKQLEGAESEMLALQNAQIAQASLADAIARLEAQIAEYSAERASLAQEAPDNLDEQIEAAEAEALNAEEIHKAALTQVAAYTQRIEQLGVARVRLAEIQKERDGKTATVNQLKLLEKAFGKNGVPALLIEQALPEIESKANDLLELLSGGSSRLRFVTQAAYKDAKRADMKETLDILISDPAGEREYEMFSGGEAFRINFAVRVALSEVLASRAGTRVQTLVIDEGFGSQDALGRQRLIEAINAVKGRFAKILVVSHIDEIKDAFPNRIELSKVDGSTAITVQ